MEHQTLYYGDCLDWMRQWDGESADLIYLDPPFNSNATYNILFNTGNGTPAQVRAFTDTWRWDAVAAERTQRILNAVRHPAHQVVGGLRQLLGESGMLAYLTYMAERLVEIHRILKSTGSVYFHCDPVASHYVKVLMDGVFGNSSFKNEIIWKRTSAHSDAKALGRTHDVILFYTKDNSKFTWNRQYQDYDPEYINSHYRYKTDDGRIYRTDNLTATGLSGGGYEYDWNGITRIWRSPRETMERLQREGRIRYTRNGVAEYIRYLDEMPGVPLQDMWTDISPLNSQARERLGFPTQKPLALLRRIIDASSNPGDMVLDPFCGCGTTVVAAHELDRRWAGIDISAFAIDVVQERRLSPAGLQAKTEGIPRDMASARRLASEKPFDFEAWAINLIQGLAPNENQRGDGGIDGRGTLIVTPSNIDSRGVIAQVKGGRFVLGQLREFLHVVGREDAALGIYITLERVESPRARAEAREFGSVRVGAAEYPRIQMWSIYEWFENGATPRMPSMADPFTGEEIGIQQGLV